MSGKKVLFLNHKPSQCGVYEFGRNLGLALERSGGSFFYRECDSARELSHILGSERPDSIIYNYHPATMDWLDVSITIEIDRPQLGLIHEVTQEVADAADTRLFNFHVAHDPTLVLRNPIVYKAGRLIPRYENRFPTPDIPTIGSFGFAGKKGYKRIVEKVASEFEHAIIRINIPFATFGDRDGQMATEIAEECRRAATPGIQLRITHDFLTQSELLDFLAQNTVNLFLYEPMEEGRGISAVPDLAFAVGRPVGITRQKMFRHITSAMPSICIEETSITKIIENGVTPIEQFRRDWTEEVICWDYERIVADVFNRPEIPAIFDRNSFGRRAKRGIKKVLGLNHRAQEHRGDPGDRSKTPKRPLGYRSAPVPEDWPLNNILDNKARGIFATTIEQMSAALPELMKRKIPEANVQQAFVLDTVYKLAEGGNAKILCVGSYDDSAAAFLKLIGLEIEEIDPAINYDLAMFMTKPTTTTGSYDIVFSTSVIEHVEQDEQFFGQIASLLKPGGRAVLTCDYNNNFKPGDPKPVVDYRLYTEADLQDRLLPAAAGCDLVDEPNWKCDDPDFWFEGVNYTFASIVLEKRRGQ